MSPRVFAHHLLGGSAATSLLYSMAELGIADLLDQRPRTVPQLAVLTDTCVDPLERVMRGLAALGLVQQAPDTTYVLTPLGACLRSTDPESLQPLARLVGAPVIQQAWSSLLHMLRTGQPAFDHAVGTDFGTWLARDPDGAERFHVLVADTTRRVVTGVVASYDFSGFRQVVDVGGGSGVLVRHILRATPRLGGMIFDRGHTRAHAERAIAADGLSDRCVFVAGDCFRKVPAGADAYLLNAVLHDWDDERCVRLLRACRRAMRPTSRLLVIEQVLAADEHANAEVILSDLFMLTTGIGRERSADEYARLCATAGLRLRRVLPTGAGPHLLELLPHRGQSASRVALLRHPRIRPDPRLATSRRKGTPASGAVVR